MNSQSVSFRRVGVGLQRMSLEPFNPRQTENQLLEGVLSGLQLASRKGQPTRRVSQFGNVTKYCRIPKASMREAVDNCGIQSMILIP